VIFLDTGFLFALVSKRDAHHERVVDVFREFQNRRLQDHLLTTNHVVAEAITLTLKIGHDKAVKLGDTYPRRRFGNPLHARLRLSDMGDSRPNRRP
jgi:predicted nucleic acid-binding protein